MTLLTFLIIGAYLLFLISIGLVFRKLNKDESDFFRAGCRGTWWIVGMSIYMSGISTQTFVANAGVAYRSGFNVLTIYMVNSACYLILFAGVAAWYRQARVTTAAEMVRERFGPAFQQLTCYVGMAFAPVLMGFGLYQLSIFANSAFQLPLQLTIVVLGCVVLFYTLLGGNWAVLASDFLQSLVLLPMVVLLAVLSLHEIGWFGGFIEKLNSLPGLREEFSVTPAARGNGLYGWEWLAGIMIMQLYGNLSMGGPGARLFSCKDGREARRAALLLFVVASLAVLVYFIPPMVARLLYAAEIDAANGADTSFAFMSKRLLPNGFLPLMVVAMFSAQLSTLDTALNANSAIFVKNVYPPLMRLFGRIPSTDHRFLLKLGRYLTLMFGIALVCSALYFSRNPGEKGVFEMGFRLATLLSVPLLLPTFWGFFIRRTPWFTAWAASGAALFVSIAGMVFDLASGRILLIDTGVALLVFLIGRVCWQFTAPGQRAVIDAFFKRLHLPVDFKHEVGDDSDSAILKRIGMMATVLGGFFLLFLFFPQPHFYLRFGVLAVGGSVLGIGVLLLFAERRRRS